MATVRRWWCIPRRHPPLCVSRWCHRPAPAMSGRLDAGHGRTTVIAGSRGTGSRIKMSARHLRRRPGRSSSSATSGRRTQLMTAYASSRRRNVPRWQLARRAVTSRRPRCVSSQGMGGHGTRANDKKSIGRREAGKKRIGRSGTVGRPPGAGIQTVPVLRAAASATSRLRPEGLAGRCCSLGRSPRPGRRAGFGCRRFRRTRRWWRGP